MGGGKGATIGGVAGAAIGLLAGPALIVPAAVGALLGGLAAKLRDGGFSDERLKVLGESLTPGSSAIVAVVEHKWVALVEQEMQEAGADLLTAALGADIAEQLEAGHDVAYSALSTQEGFAASRVAGGEDEVEGGEIIITDEAISGSQFVATPDGFAVRSILATDEGIVGGVIAATTGEEEEQAWAVGV